ncbi:hypothetical protein [Leucobacter salsicius]|uniref:hypothetical protein n=1 Tax=Leucobacter salsicius TaxID=664638 RepID=UPI00034D82EC|nr:hypothetical protein [Leucobacter salsicius]
MNATRSSPGMSDRGNAVPDGTTTLAKGRLGTWDIVFFVISAAAPLTVILSGAITSFRMGGVGPPARSYSVPSC